MLKRFFLTAVFWGIAFNGLFANDVALVTELKGEVSATLAQENWPVTLAEMLPDGVEIRVASDSSLVVIHMLNNHEYKFSAGAVASFSAAGVTGNISSENLLQLASNDFKLGADSGNQAGAAHPDRGVAASSDEGSFDRSDDARNVKGKTLAGAFPDKLEKEPNKSLDMSELFDESAQERNSEQSVSEISPAEAGASPAPAPIQSPKPAPASGFSAETQQEKPAASLTSESNATTAVVASDKIELALPEKLLATITKDNILLDCGGELVDDFSVANPDSGWVKISISLATAPDCLTLDVLEKEPGSVDQILSASGSYLIMTVKGKNGELPVNTTLAAGKNPSLVMAWQLEKTGFYAQAAVMWLNIKASGFLSDQQVKKHLDRLQEKLAR